MTCDLFAVAAIRGNIGCAVTSTLL